MVREIEKAVKRRFLVPPTWTSKPSTLTFEAWKVRDCIERLRVTWDNLSIGRLSRKHPAALQRDCRLSFGCAVAAAVDSLLVGCWRPHDYSKAIEILAKYSLEPLKRSFSALTLHRYWVYYVVLDPAAREIMVLLECEYSTYQSKILRAIYRRYVRDWYLANPNEVQPDSWEDISSGLDTWSESINDKQPSVRKGNVLAFPGGGPSVEKRRPVEDTGHAQGALVAVDAGSAEALIAQSMVKPHGIRNELQELERQMVTLARHVKVTEDQGSASCVELVEIRSKLEAISMATQVLRGRLARLSPPEEMKQIGTERSDNGQTEAQNGRRGSPGPEAGHSGIGGGKRGGTTETSA